MTYRKLLLIGILSVGLLSGCLGSKPEANLYTAFENAAKQEKTMLKDVHRLEKIEKKGQELYAQIIKDGKDTNETVKGILDQAVKNIDEREKVLKSEEDSMDQAQKEMEPVNKKIKKIRDNNIQKQAKKATEAYTNRYDSFKKMNESYRKLIVLEKELYENLRTKNTELKKIDKDVKKLNQLNEEIQLEKGNFNGFTKEYNKEKLDFYKKANIKIKKDK